jgi:hypothetical protein
MVDPCPRETQNYHSFSGLFRSPVDTPPEISARGRPGRVREQPLSVSIVSFIVFPCLSHLALHHPVLHFSGHFYHSPTNLLYKFRTTRVLPPPTEETPTRNLKPTTPSYHMSSGPGNEEDPPAGQSHAASSAEGPGGGEDPPYEDISRDHRAGGEAQNKTREVSQSPP